MKKSAAGARSRRITLAMLAWLFATLAASMPAKASGPQAFDVAFLAGTWAADCRQPPSPTNTYTRYDPIDERLTNYAVTYRGIWTEDKLTVAVPGTARDEILSFEVIAYGQVYYMGKLLRSGDGIRVWEMVDKETGRAGVSNGVVQNTMSETHVLSRCPEAGT